VRGERLGDARVRVHLDSPTEPLAWAVDPAFRGSGPFSAAWHSERVPGTKARPALRAADVSVAPGSDVGVRVFHDDGALSEHVIAASELEVA
jgi:hypothetical protein